MMIYRKRNAHKVLFATAAWIAHPAFAQTSAATPVATPAPPAAENDTQDIVVTANRREERAQRVGISITAVGGDTLVQRNVLNSEDLGRLVPGLNSTSQSGSGVAPFVIRGVGETDVSDHQEQPNASYQDGVYIPFSTAAGVPLFDLQRIEALRGPQGTLFGRNATGGLIQYISNKPQAGTSGSVEAAAGTRNLARVQGFINAGSDIVAGRLAYYYQSQDGYIKNTLGPDRGNKKIYALRGQVQIKPGPNTTILLRADGFNQRGTAPGYKATPAYFVNGVATDLPANVDAYGTGPGNDLFGYRNPFPGLTVSLDDPGILNKEARTFSATLSQQIGDATITSVTSYGTAKNDYREDSDSTPIRSFRAYSGSDAHDFQQELRIIGSADRLRYTAGAFYVNIDGDYFSKLELLNVPGFGLPPGGSSRLDNDYSLRTRSEAIYGQIEYDLTPQVTAILGARYTWDQLRFGYTNTCFQTIVGSCALQGSDPAAPGLVVPGIAPLTLYSSNNDWSGKAQLNYKPTPDVLLYASASKGLKSGGFTAAQVTNFPIDHFGFKPETLYAYEVGVKSQLLDRKVTLNVGAYYYDYRNFQTFLFENVAAEVLNRNAKAYGGELELSVRPGQGFSASLGAAYNHFAVKDALAGLPDQRPNNAPRLQLNWNLTKSIDFGSGYSLDASYSGRYIGATYYNVVNTPSVRAEEYNVHDVSLRLASTRGWYLAAYLNNIFDKRYQVGAFDITGFGYILRQYGEVRTFSGAVGFKF